MERSLSIYRYIRRLYRLSQKYYVSQTEYPELTPADLQLIKHIGFHGEVSQRHLSEEMNIDKAMISRTLQKLEARGYLVRRGEEKDARSKRVIALPPAVDLYKQGQNLYEQFFDRITGEVPPDDLALFAQVLEQILGNARELCRQTSDASCQPRRDSKAGKENVSGESAGQEQVSEESLTNMEPSSPYAEKVPGKEEASS